MRDQKGGIEASAFSEVWAAFLALCSVLILPKLLAKLPWVLNAFFVTPSAHVAALLMGVPLDSMEEGRLLLLPAYGRAMEVTCECSGTGFFSLLIALVLWHTARGRRLHFFALLPLAFPVALMVNGSRIAAGAWVGAMIDNHFGPHYHDMAHMLLGSMVFLPALYVVHLLLNHVSLRIESPEKCL